MFLVVVGFAIVSSPGWERVKATFFDREIARESLPPILEGLWLNIRVLAVTAVLVVIVGLLLASLRTLRGPIWFPIRALAAAYTDFFRGMPLIILLYLSASGPGAAAARGADGPGRAGHDRAGADLLGVRLGGLPRRHRVGAPEPAGRGPVARADYGQTMRRVVLPQAVRRVVPPLLNDFVALQKDVGLISVLGICNGFQVLCESHLLPGALIRNDHRRFGCVDQDLRVENNGPPWTSGTQPASAIVVPLKNGEGGYVADDRRWTGSRPRAGSSCGTSGTTRTGPTEASPGSPTSAATSSG